MLRIAALALLAAVACRRDAGDRQRIAEAAAPSRPPLWVIGLDGADWRYLDSSMAAGAMPELARLVREGRRGVLVTEHPPLSPLLWTTMMTGVSPLEHRILDFVRFAPGGGYEPITSSERRVPAIWNMANAAGRRVVVLGLWATHPAEQVGGLMVSDRFYADLPDRAAPPGSVAPADRTTWAKERLQRARDSAAELAALRRFVPWLGEAELSSIERAPDPYTHPLGVLRRTLVETAAYDALFRDAVAELAPDLAVLYVKGTDTVGHAFARHAPPALPEVPAGEAARYGGVAAAYFGYVDELLGHYRRLAEQRGARLLLVSDHGFRWQDDRPRGLSPSAHNTAGRWHQQEGIWLLWGPGVRPGGGVTAGIRQLCATVLDLLELPPASGVAGPSFAADARTVPAPARPAVDYRRGFRSPPRVAGDGSADAGGGEESLAALRALGYAAGGDAGPGAQRPAGGAAKEPTRSAGSYDNEALILLADGKVTAARAALETALAVEPRNTSAAWNLFDLLRDQGVDDQRADELLLLSLEAWLPERGVALAGRARRYAAAGERDRALGLLEEGLKRLGDRADAWQLWLLAGHLRLEGEQCAPALRQLERAATLAPQQAEAHAAVGVAQLCLGDAAAAAAALRRSLALDPDQPQVRQRLAELGG
jgi:tetratricopeptide (TPR) repeat protein